VAEDLKATAKRLEEAGVAFARRERELVVNPTTAMGAAIVFCVA